MATTQMIGDAYVAEGEWSRVVVRPSRKGWIVEKWSQVQGEITGRKVLVPHGNDIPKSQDLMAQYNVWMQYGDLVYQRSHGGARVLRKGYTVQ